MSVEFARTVMWRRRWRSGLAAAVVMAVVGGLITVATTPASAATVDTTAWYVLVNRNSGKAMDVSSLSTADGAQSTSGPVTTEPTSSASSWTPVAATTG